MGTTWRNQSVDEISERLLQFLPRTIAEEDWNFDPEVDQDLIPIRWMIRGVDFGYPFHGQVKSGDELKKVIVAFLDDASIIKFSPFEFEEICLRLHQRNPKKLTWDTRTMFCAWKFKLTRYQLLQSTNADGSSSGTFVQTALVQRCWGVASRINTPDKVIWLSSSLQNIAWLFSKDISVLRAIAD
jgi:hypothetical protein